MRTMRSAVNTCRLILPVSPEWFLVIFITFAYVDGGVMAGSVLWLSDVREVVSTETDLPQRHKDTELFIFFSRCLCASVVIIIKSRRWLVIIANLRARPECVLQQRTF